MVLVILAQANVHWYYTHYTQTEPIWGRNKLEMWLLGLVHH